MSRPALTDIQNAPHQLPKKLTRQEKFFLGEIKNIATARLVEYRSTQPTDSLRSEVLKGHLPVLGNVDAVEMTASSLCPSCKRYCMQNEKVQLIPCQDEICLECHLMESGRSSVTCACCKEAVAGHCVQRLVGQNWQVSSRMTYPTPCLDLRAHPDKIKDPHRNLCLELQSLGNDEKIGRGVLFYSKYIGRGKFCILTSRFNRKTGFIGDDSSFVSLKRIFSQLKADTIDVVPYDKTSTALNPRELKNYLLQSDDRIRDLCYCISTGEDIDEAILEKVRGKKGSSNTKSKLYAASIMASMWKRTNQHVPDIIQRTLGELIWTMSERNNNLISFLCSLRVTCSLTCIDTEVCGRMTKKCVRKFVVGDHCFVFFCTDNFHLERKGLDATKVQYTLIAIHTVTRPELEEVGFFCKDPSKRHSREWKTMETFVREQEIAGNDPGCAFVDINDHDEDAWTQYNIIPLVKASKLRLPSLEKAIVIKRNWRRSKAKRSYHSCSTGIDLPMNLGIAVLEPPSNRKPVGKRIPEKVQVYSSPSPRDVAIDGDDEDEVQDASFIQTMNIQVDTPLQMDQGSHSTVSHVNGYIAGWTKGYISDQTSKMEPGEERPINEVKTPAVGDGAPTSLSLADQAIHAMYGNEDSCFNHIQVVSGGFHFYLENIRKVNELMYDMKQAMILQFRPSVKKQKHYLEARRSNQFEEEVIQVIYAQARAAVDSFIDAFPEEDEKKLTFDKLNQHMLDRAKEYPICHAMLLEYRWTMIYFILRDAEKNGDLDLFFLAVKLSMPLFTTTNCTTYTRLGAHLLRWYHLASDAEKILGEAFFFTRKNADGKRFYVDKVQELINEVYRQECGKYHTARSHKKLMRLSLELGEVIEKRKSKQILNDRHLTRPRGPFNQRCVKLGTPYIEVYLMLMQMNVWGVGPPKLGKRFNVKASKTVLTSPLNRPVPALLLRAPTIGRKRARDYVTRYEINAWEGDKRPVTDGHGNCLVGRLIKTADSAQKEENSKLVLGTSTNFNKVKKSAGGKKKPLIEQLIEIRPLLGDIDEAAIITTEDDMKRQSMDDLAKLLVRCRKKYFRSDPDARDIAISTVHSKKSVDSECNNAERITMLERCKFTCLRLESILTAPYNAIPIPNGINYM